LQTRACWKEEWGIIGEVDKEGRIKRCRYVRRIQKSWIQKGRNQSNQSRSEEMQKEKHARICDER
jgi:hypothetical protein